MRKKYVNFSLRLIVIINSVPELIVETVLK